MTKPAPTYIGVAAAIATGLFVLPIVGLFTKLSWNTLLADSTSPEALAALRLSMITSLSAATLALVLGLPLAWMLARWNFPGRSIVRGIVLLPLVLPPVVGGVALLSVFSRGGLVGKGLYEMAGIDLPFSTAGAVLAATYVSLPFFVITVEAALRSLDVTYEEAAIVLGATRREAMRRVTLPLIAPAVGAGVVLSWARALGEFGATITFAGNIVGRTQTLPLAVYQQIEANPDAGYALSFLLVVLSLLVFIALRGRLGAAGSAPR